VVVVAILMVAAAFVITRGSDGGDAPVAKPVTGEDISHTRLVRAITAPAQLPPGDYTALCEVLTKQAQMPSDVTFTDFIDAYRQFDFPALIQAAPPGARSIFEDLRDTREDVLAVYDDSASLADLNPEDFPQRWLLAVGALFKIGISQCVGTAGGG
jgi:hypothetical protein